MLEEKSKEILSYLEESIEIVEKMGIRVVDLKNRYAKLMLPKNPNRNHIGSVYAGSLFTLGEMAGGAVFLASFDYTQFYPVVKELTIRFKKPATTDMTVEVELTEKQVKDMNETARLMGKADWAMNLEIKDENGDVCCLVNGIWQMRKSDGKWP
jgi:thioesterase domain-containing protein